MKIKSFLAIAIAFTTLSIATTSCNNDEPEIPAAESLAGTYSGSLYISVAGEESTDAATYIITKIDDTTVSMTIPAAGSGMMALPSIIVDDISAVKTTVDGVEVVKASIDALSGTITVNGVEKSYNFTNLVILGSDDKVSINYDLQYGKMPFAMTCAFTGTK